VKFSICENFSSEKSKMYNHYQKLIKAITCQALVAHSCNPSYLGGKGQEDPGSKLVPASISRNFILGWGEGGRNDPNIVCIYE
jgi:hypothetical protein